MLTMPFGLVFGSWHVGKVYCERYVIHMPTGKLVMGHTDSLLLGCLLFSLSGVLMECVPLYVFSQLPEIKILKFVDYLEYAGYI